VPPHIPAGRRTIKHPPPTPRPPQPRHPLLFGVGGPLQWVMSRRLGRPALKTNAGTAPNTWVTGQRTARRAPSRPSPAADRLAAPHPAPVRHALPPRARQARLTSAKSRRHLVFALRGGFEGLPEPFAWFRPERRPGAGCPSTWWAEVPRSEVTSTPSWPGGEAPSPWSIVRSWSLLGPAAPGVLWQRASRHTTIFVRRGHRGTSRPARTRELLLEGPQPL